MTSLVNAVELAAALRVRPSTVRRWTREGRLPVIRISGTVLRYDPAEVECALRERAQNRKGGGHA